MAPAPIDCPTCSARIRLEYCPSCGERRRRVGDLSLASYARQFLEGLTSLDGKSWRSVIALARPGFLTHEFVRGVRQRYLRPVGLFVLANVVYFFLHRFTGARTFNTSLEIHRSQLMHSRLAREWVDARLAASGESLVDYATRFDASTDTFSRTLLVLLAPGFAVALALFVHKRPFGVHLTFALHFLAFFILYIAIGATIAIDRVVVLLARLGPNLSAWQSETTMTMFALAACAVYATMGLRRAYGGSWARACGVGAGLTVAFGILVQLYRALLFFVVHWLL